MHKNSDKEYIFTEKDINSLYCEIEHLYDATQELKDMTNALANYCVEITPSLKELIALIHRSKNNILANVGCIFHGNASIVSQVKRQIYREEEIDD